MAAEGYMGLRAEQPEGRARTDGSVVHTLWPQADVSTSWDLFVSFGWLLTEAEREQVVELIHGWAMSATVAP